MINTENLIQHLNKYLLPDETLWLKQALALLKTSDDPIEELLNLSVVVKRKVSSIEVLENIPTEFDINTGQVSELIRICFLAQVLNHHPALTISKVIKNYYQAGDSSEKSALLKGLSGLDPKGEAVNLAVNAARCNSADEFSALAINNGYPSKHFQDLNFNQLVLKALFMGLPIDGFVGLNNRLSTSLSNMCFSYAVEQALAERIPPASLWLAVKYDDLTVEHQVDFEHYVQHFANQDQQHKEKISTLIEFQDLTFVKL
jgi:hypothetical protein